MQVMLGDMSAMEALAAAKSGQARASELIAMSDGSSVGNFWLTAASYIAAPAKGGTQVIRKSSASGIKPETIALAALAAVGAYLALS